MTTLVVTKGEWKMIEQLRQLGWTEYEARLYVALLQYGPATGYRAARTAGVPGAKVYEALSRLVERGAVTAGPATAGSTLYTPVAPEEVMAGIRARQSRLLDDLTRGLSAMTAPSDEANGAQWLQGRAPVLGRIAALIGGARKRVEIIVPRQWRTTVEPLCSSCARRGVHTDLLAARAGGLNSRQTGPDRLVVLVDGHTALLGTLGAPESDRDAECLVTTKPYVVGMCEESLRLARAAATLTQALTERVESPAWLDWEAAKQRRLLTRSEPSDTVSIH